MVRHGWIVWCGLIAACSSDPLRGDIEAGVIAQRAGIVSFAKSIPDNRLPITVTLFDRDSKVLGTSTLSVEPAGRLVTRLVLRDGETAEHTLHVTAPGPAAPVTTDERLVFGDQTLRILTVLDVLGGEPQARSIRLETAVARDTFPAGGARPEPDAFHLDLVVVRDGATVTPPDETARWLLRAGLGPLVESRAITMLTAMRADPELVRVLYLELERITAGKFTDVHSARAPVHKTGTCVLLMPVQAGGSILSCPSCEIFTAGIPATGGLSALIAIYPCVACAAALYNFGICMDAIVNYTTPADCAAAPCWASWQRGTVNEDEHGCACVCDSLMCDQRCRELPGTTYSSSECGSDQICRCGTQTCNVNAAQTDGAPLMSCPIDDSALCGYAHPTTSCGVATRDPVTDVLTCATACGNGVVDTTCASNPAYREICDASAGAASTCPAGQICDQCRCRPTFAPPLDASDPYSLCANRDYEAAYALFLAGVDINLMRTPGDAGITVATCAFAHHDYPAAEDLATRAGTGGSGGGRAHSMFIAEYAVERLGGNPDTYRAQGLEAARGSGQCANATDLDACAESYRSSIRAILEQRERDAAAQRR